MRAPTGAYLSPRCTLGESDRGELRIKKKLRVTTLTTVNPIVINRIRCSKLGPLCGMLLGDRSIARGADEHSSNNSYQDV